MRTLEPLGEEYFWNHTLYGAADTKPSVWVTIAILGMFAAAVVGTFYYVRGSETGAW